MRLDRVGKGVHAGGRRQGRGHSAALENVRFLIRKVDVRLVFATNRDLNAEMEAGRFGDAIYHRLNVFNIALPSLRSRREDIPALIEYFLGRLCPGERMARITDRALQCLMACK